MTSSKVDSGLQHSVWSSRTGLADTNDKAPSGSDGSQLWYSRRNISRIFLLKFPLKNFPCLEFLLTSSLSMAWRIRIDRKTAESPIHIRDSAGIILTWKVVVIYRQFLCSLSRSAQRKWLRMPTSNRMHYSVSNIKRISLLSVGAFLGYRRSSLSYLHRFKRSVCYVFWS